MASCVWDPDCSGPVWVVVQFRPVCEAHASALIDAELETRTSVTVGRPVEPEPA